MNNQFPSFPTPAELGYDGDRKRVAFWWEPLGDELAISDGKFESVGMANNNLFLDWLQSVGYPVLEIGDSETSAKNVILVDMEKHTVDLLPKAETLKQLTEEALCDDRVLLDQLFAAPVHVEERNYTELRDALLEIQSMCDRVNDRYGFNFTAEGTLKDIKSMAKETLALVSQSLPSLGEEDPATPALRAGASVAITGEGAEYLAAIARLEETLSTSYLRWYLCYGPKVNKFIGVKREWSVSCGSAADLVMMVQVLEQNNVTTAPVDDHAYERDERDPIYWRTDQTKAFLELQERADETEQPPAWLESLYAEHMEGKHDHFIESCPGCETEKRGFDAEREEM